MSDQFNYFDDPSVVVPEQPTVVYTRGDYQQSSYQQPSNSDDLQAQTYQPQQVTEQMIQMRRKQDQIRLRLQSKAQNEATLKQQRKQSGKQQLQRFKKLKQIQKKKEQNRQQKQEKTEKVYQNPWLKIVDNIPKKQDAQGNKNILRFRELLVNKSKDVNV